MKYEELRWNEQPLYCPSNINDERSTPVDSDVAVPAPHPADQNHANNNDNRGCNYNDGSTANSTTHGTKLASIPIHATSTALLIVDVQPEYWSRSPTVRRDFPRFEENLRRTLAVAREKRAKIIWVRADYRKSHSPWLAQFERLNKMANSGGRKREGMVGELPCEPGSGEFAWEEFATPEGGETIITKPSWSSTNNTALMDILRISGVDTVLVCGLITSVCVQHSAFGVFEAGCRTILVEDACGDRGRARHDAAIALYGGYMYELTSSRELGDPGSVGRLRRAEPVWITTRSRSGSWESSAGIGTGTDMGAGVKRRRVSDGEDSESEIRTGPRGVVVYAGENRRLSGGISECSCASVG